MIRLTLMKEWFDTVDGEGRSPIAERIAAPWFAAPRGRRGALWSGQLQHRVPRDRRGPRVLPALQPRERAQRGRLCRRDGLRGTSGRAGSAGGPPRAVASGCAGRAGGHAAGPLLRGAPGGRAGRSTGAAGAGRAVPAGMGPHDGWPPRRRRGVWGRWPTRLATTPGRRHRPDPRRRRGCPP